jgi:nitrous oxidase accessory protein NosD
MARAASTSFWGLPVALSLAIVCMVSIVCAASTRSNTISVKSGQSIQAAIHSAQNGDQIVVGAGTYAEQLTIQKDGITLVGHNAILVPPTTIVQNTCSGLAGPHTQAGICVEGSGIKLAPYITEHRKVLSVGTPVKHVSISGFEILGFSGANIAVVGGQDVQVTGNWLYDGEQYGVVTAGCTNTLVSKNTVISGTKLLFIGICTDNVMGSQVLSNYVSGYYVGLCIQTSGEEVQNNDVTSCCVDAFVDPSVIGAKVQQNRFSAINPNCNITYGGGGVFLQGSINSSVSNNLIEGQMSGGLAVGVAVFDDLTTTPVSVASGNVVADNILLHNDLDLYINTTGTGNVFTNNQCTTPKKLCS